ncbi:MAG: DUF4405 domain-containing protein [Bacteroidales bacterium]|nr:DUF4405 domain-containing protein [Bacteroidales bacterium]
MKQKQNRLIVNNLLLVSGIIMTISGLVQQVGFHMDNHGDQLQADQLVWGLEHTEWSVIHKVTIVIFSVLMICHFLTHWKWYKGVISKNLIRKNRQVFILSVLFALVAITGLIPWFIDLSGGTGSLRMILIEIHDKLALFLAIFLILHLVKRIKFLKFWVVQHSDNQ